MLTDHQVVIEMALWHVRIIFHIWENSHGAKMRRARLEAITRALINHDRLLINHDRLINGEMARRGFSIRPQRSQLDDIDVADLKFHRGGA